MGGAIGEWSNERPLGPARQCKNSTSVQEQGIAPNRWRIATPIIFSTNVFLLRLEEGLYPKPGVGKPGVRKPGVRKPSVRKPSARELYMCFLRAKPRQNPSFICFLKRQLHLPLKG